MSRLSYRILLASVFVPIFLMALIKIGDYDIWYHLKAGEYILATGSINNLDPFSYTTPNLPWPVHSWLATVIYFKAYSLAGVSGLIVFNALLITLSFFIILLTMRLYMKEPGELLFGVMVLIVAAFAIRFRMWLRPHVFEFLFLASVVYILNAYKSRGKNLLFLLPLIQIVWVNTHGSYILGIVTVCIYIAGGFAGRVLYGPSDAMPFKRFVSVMAAVLIADVVATMVNPDTYNTLISTFSILSPSMQNINEFQPLKLHHLWGYEMRYTWGLSVLFILGVAGFAFNRKKIDITDILLFFAFFVMAVKGIRYIAEFSIIAAPIACKNLCAPAYKVLKRIERPAAALLAAFLLLAVTPFIATSKTYKVGLGVKDNIFPEKALNFIEKAGIQGNMFNSYSFGDYIIWKTFPARKVFIHGHSRSEVFPQDFYQEYLDAHTSLEAWDALTGKYDVSYAVLEYYLTDYGGKEAIPHLAGNQEWVPVYWDRLAIVYVKKTAENMGIIDKFGYRLIRPTYQDFSYLEHYIKNGMGQTLLKELTRLIAESPDNEEAYLARADVYFILGPGFYRQAIEDLKKAITINPVQAISHSALGLVYMKVNDPKGAQAEFKEALRLDPEDALAKNGLKYLGSRR